MTEDWDPKWHKDASIWRNGGEIVDTTSNEVVRRVEPKEFFVLNRHQRFDSKRVEVPDEDKTRRQHRFEKDRCVVDDRVISLLVHLPGRDVEAPLVPIDVHVDANSPGRLTLKIFYYDGKRRIKLHSALKKNGRLWQSLKEWPLQYVDLPDSEHFERHGYRKEKRDGWEFYTILSLVQAIGTATDRRIRLRMLTADETIQCDTEIEVDAHDLEYRTIFDQTTELWHSERAHTITGNPYLSSAQLKGHKRKRETADPRVSNTIAEQANDARSTIVILDSDNENAAGRGTQLTTPRPGTTHQSLSGDRTSGLRDRREPNAVRLQRGDHGSRSLVASTHPTTHTPTASDALLDQME